MAFQKVVTKVSPASMARGHKTLPTLIRRLHYQASEADREGVQLVDSQGKDLSIPEALERMGGEQSKYIELVSDASVLETQCLMERQPGIDPDEVMREHFAAQAEELERRYFEGRKCITVACHKEVDGSYHAHHLLPGDEDSLRAALGTGQRQKNLHGPHGYAIQAWDEAWKSGQNLQLSREQWAQIRHEQKKVRDQVRELLRERNRLHKESSSVLKSSAVSSSEDRLRIREETAARDRGIAGSIHSLETDQINRFWAVAGGTDSLEHLVDLEREAHRHTGDMRKVEARELGISVARVRQTAATERESFRHLHPDERLEIRERGLARELAAVRLKHTAQQRGMNPADHDHFERTTRQEREIEGILLQFEASRLRDREGELSRASSAFQSWSDKIRDGLGAERKYRQKTILNWSATYDTRRELVTQRQSLERKALQAQAESMGRSDPSPEMLRKLETRQAKERKDLAMEPIRLGLQKGVKKVQGKAVAIGRSLAKMPAQAVSKALADLQKAGRRAGGQVGPKPPAEIEAVGRAAKGAGIAVARGAVKVATTMAIESAKMIAHQSKHAAQGCAVTAKAIATGVINPVAGAKVAAQGYSEVGTNALKSGAQDLKQMGSKTAQDTAHASKQIVGQTLGGITSMGMTAAPAEVKAAVKTATELAKTAIRTSRALVQGAIQLNPLAVLGGAAKEFAQGTQNTAKAAGSGLVSAKLPKVVETPLNIAAKVPILGLIAAGMKQGAELGVGVTVAKGPSMNLDR